MTKCEMFATIQSQLAYNLNCTVDDLNGEKDSFVFVEAKEAYGPILVPPNRQYFGMFTMGKAIIVTATPARLKYAKEQLIGKSRDDAFAMPFICGHSLFYMPDLDNFKPLSAPDGFLYETVEKEKLSELREVRGFNNALQYDLNHPFQNTLVLTARHRDVIVAMAGTGTWTDCPKLWAIGIDVLPEYRNTGLAAYLVNALTVEILKRDGIPLYATNSSNIASQKVAYKAGFMPIAMCDYKVRFEGELSNS